MRILLLFLVLLPLCAQTPVTLNLADAERLALQNNPQYAAARYTADASHQVPVELRGAELPQVQGAATGVGADSGSRLAAGGLNNPIVYNRLGTGLLASQLLTDFGRTGNLIGSAKLRAEAQDQTTETTRTDILLSVARGYYGVLRAETVLKVAQETVSARQLVSDQITALAKNNLKSGLDVSFANVNFSDAKLLLSQSENDLRSSEAQLSAVVNLPLETTFSLAEEPMPDALPDQAEPLIQQALQNRPEIKAARLEQLASEQFAKAEHALIYPTVQAAGTAGFVPARESPVPGRYGAIGVNVTIPILNGGVFRARQTEAELKAKAANEQLRDREILVSRDVRIAYLNARTAFDRLSLTAQLLNQARLALDLARGRYDLGLSSIIELSQAQLNLTSAEIADTTAHYDYQTQRKILDYQVGVLR